MRIGALCFGYGGLDLAVQSVFPDAELAWYAEFDKAASKIGAHRFPGLPNYGDLTKVDWAAVEPVEIITAGYPCQPFSGNGQRKGQDDPRHLWPHVLRAIRSIRPNLVVLENVEDHLTLGFGAVLGDLAASGFDAEWCLLRASDVGAPHGRPRLFIAATDPSRVVHATEEPRGMAGEVRPQPALAGAERVDRPGAGDHEDEGATDTRGASGSFGPYAEAVERWAGVIGRRPPEPLVERAGDPDINPRFVEWAMGLPAGWVTEVPGLTVNHQFKALGNGVVPQQAAAALRLMLDVQVAAA